jgi:hypothetical protein
MARSGVGRGEHHNAADSALDFLGNCGRMGGLRLFSRRNQAKSYQRKPCGKRRWTNISPAISLSKKQRGGSWKGSGGTVPFIKEAKPSL